MIVRPRVFAVRMSADLIHSRSPVTVTSEERQPPARGHGPRSAALPHTERGFLLCFSWRSAMCLSELWCVVPAVVALFPGVWSWVGSVRACALRCEDAPHLQPLAAGASAFSLPALLCRGGAGRPGPEFAIALPLKVTFVSQVASARKQPLCVGEQPPPPPASHLQGPLGQSGFVWLSGCRWALQDKRPFFGDTALGGRG